MVLSTMKENSINKTLQEYVYKGWEGWKKIQQEENTTGQIQGDGDINKN